jgi:hypothetical protein
MVTKDFVGPVATIITAVTAGVIAFIFSSRKVKVAEQQCDTRPPSISCAIMLNRRHETGFGAFDLASCNVAIGEVRSICGRNRRHDVLAIRWKSA